jgi:cyclophilin family peptidyl-prolyl cis-trans isomerase
MSQKTVSRAQRKKQKRNAALAAKRQAELRRRRLIASVVLALAALGIVVLVALMVLRERKPAEPALEIEAKGSQFTPGEGLMCPEPVRKPERAHEYPGPPRPYIDPQRRYVAKMEIYTFGVITVELLAKEAPWAVNNFVFLACDGFYESSKFVRLVDTPQMKILQGGDSINQDGTGHPYGGVGFKDELEVAKREGYRRGMLAMANSGPDTNGSQFFFVVQDSLIPPNYTVFGKIIDGIDVLDRAFDVGTPAINGDGIPARDLYLSWVTIEEDPPSGRSLGSSSPAPAPSEPQPYG